MGSADVDPLLCRCNVVGVVGVPTEVCVLQDRVYLTPRPLLRVCVFVKCLLLSLAEALIIN